MATRKVEGLITIEDARIGFKNFSGAPDRFNKDGGKRSFCVFLDKEFAEDLLAKGWNIKWLPARDDEEENQGYIQVAVAFQYPPKIVMISSGRRTVLNGMTVNLLDKVSFKTADLTITPYNWEMNGRTGVKAYLKTLYVVLEEDEFESKYADYPMADEEVPF